MTIYKQDKAEEEYLRIKEQNDKDVKKGLLWAVAPTLAIGVATVAFLPWQAWSIGAALSAIYEGYRANKDNKQRKEANADMEIMGVEFPKHFPETCAWVQKSVLAGPAWDMSKVVVLDADKDNIPQAAATPAGYVVLNINYFKDKGAEPKFLFSMAHEFAHTKLNTTKRKRAAKTAVDFAVNASWLAIASASFSTPLSLPAFSAVWIGMMGASLLKDLAFAHASRKEEKNADALACVSLGMVDAGVVTFLDKDDEDCPDVDKKHTERLLALVEKENEVTSPIKRLFCKLRRLDTVLSFKFFNSFRSHPLNQERILSMMALDKRLTEAGVWEGFGEREKLQSSLLAVKKIQKALSKGKMSLG